MKITITFLAFVGFALFGFSQGFELNEDLNDGKIAFQGVVEADSVSQAKLIELAKEWLEKGEFKQKFVSEDLDKNEKVYEIIHSVVGKKSELGNAFNYRFSTLLKIEFKEEKIRYTFYKFLKKSSPGEPGMTMEAYIANYKPKISSTRSRDRAEARLDEIELGLYEKVSTVIQDLKNTFEPVVEEEW